MSGLTSASGTIWEIVEAALEPLGVPYGASGKIESDDSQPKPDTFIVYSLFASSTDLHADNQDSLTSYYVQVSIFSRAGLVGLPDVDGAMNAAGFMAAAGRELPYNPQTRHWGLAIDYYYATQEIQND
jgi:hypothetical protein